LLDEGENRIELALEMGNVIVRHGDARQPRDAPDRVLIDRHEWSNLEDVSRAAYSTRPLEAATDQMRTPIIFGTKT
jgi:hypothetical protein